MAQPYPLPREIRSTGTLAFDGASVTFGPFDFKIFDTADVVVELKHAGDAEWTATSAVTVTKSSAAALDTFSVTFDVIHPERRWECTQLPGSRWYKNLNPHGQPGTQCAPL